MLCLPLSLSSAITLKSFPARLHVQRARESQLTGSAHRSSEVLRASCTWIQPALTHSFHPTVGKLGAFSALSLPKQGTANPTTFPDVQNQANSGHRPGPRAAPQGRGKQSGSQAPCPRNGSVSPSRGPLKCEIKAVINSLPSQLGGVISHYCWIQERQRGKGGGRQGWRASLVRDLLCWGCWGSHGALCPSSTQWGSRSSRARQSSEGKSPVCSFLTPSSPTFCTRTAGGMGTTYHPHRAPSWQPQCSSSAGRRPPGVHTGCRR